MNMNGRKKMITEEKVVNKKSKKSSIIKRWACYFGRVYPGSEDISLVPDTPPDTSLNMNNQYYSEGVNA